MTYQVLARKWRPHNFADIVGQTHVLQALINGMTQGRLHHAYLFAGTRGVGKTTLARIIAKCLNCERGISATPCSSCDSCIAIDEGRFVDLLEIDAASRTKVEDTRDLLDNVPYTPTQGRYKVYLIDEVHMLSTHSFNALLKTLEEPPEHVKFLLATTDPQRLPITVLSRCLQFNLKTIAPVQIQQRLQFILEQESIPAEAEALALIARAANGSMRDALSLLDQAIAFGNNTVTTADVRIMLGSIEQTEILAILTALAEKNAQNLIAISQSLAEKAVDFSQVLEELLAALHSLALHQMLPDLMQDADENKKIGELAKYFVKEDIQLYYQIALIGRRDLPLAPSMQIGFEMILLRMLAFTPSEISSTPLNLFSQKRTGGEGNLSKGNPSKSTEGERNSYKSAEEKRNPQKNTETEGNPQRGIIATQDWATILPHLNLTGLTQTVASHCSIINISADRIDLVLDSGQAALLNSKLAERIEAAVQDYFANSMIVTIQVANTSIPITSPAGCKLLVEEKLNMKATQAIMEDNNVQSLLKVFNARIQPNSIHPIVTPTTEEV